MVALYLLTPVPLVHLCKQPTFQQRPVDRTVYMLNYISRKQSLCCSFPASCVYYVLILGSYTLAWWRSQVILCLKHVV